MTIRSNITDKRTGDSAEINDVEGTEKKALVVATRPLKTYTNKVQYFINDDYGIDMNVNVSFGGTPEIVHDGIDLTKWTATDIVGGGKTTFDSTDHAYEGIITVVDYSIIDNTDSFTINATTRTETTDWVAETDNDTTATNIATDINDNVTGFSASADGAVVTVTADTGYDITTFETNADAGEMTATGQAIKVDNAPLDDVYQFDKGGDLDCTGYTAITLRIYVDKDWKAGDSVEIYGWDTGTGLKVGTSVYLEDYFTYNVFDTWQKITIPLTDMGDLSASTTLDALRVKQTSKEGKAPKYYLDSIQFEETGTPVKFTVEPTKGTWLHVNSFQILLADAYTGTLADATMPNIPYDSFLGVSELSSGIKYERITNGEIVNSASISKFIDFMGFSNAKVTGSGSDGTNTWVTVNVQFTEPVILKGEDEDEMSLTINEDLSGLLLLRVGAGCKVEERE